MPTEMNFPEIGVPKQGKVRDIYNLDPYLLIVTTDRISAFDVIMPDPIRYKGWILNQLAALWFQKLAAIIPNHMITCNAEQYPKVCQPYAEELKGRSMLVRKAKPLPVECVIRGYISGSAWKDYKGGKSTCGITLPPELVESDKLSEPIFTPTTKAPDGEHDLPITFDEVSDLIGLPLATLIRDASLRLYTEGAKLALKAGIIIADTKFEFGLDENGELILIDEVLTPDSSRFWPVVGYQPGKPQPSFDKQYLRDYLVSINWDQKPPAPSLPQEVIDKTSAKYIEAYKRLAKMLAG